MKVLSGGTLKLRSYLHLLKTGLAGPFSLVFFTYLILSKNRDLVRAPDRRCMACALKFWIVVPSFWQKWKVKLCRVAWRWRSRKNLECWTFWNVKRVCWSSRRVVRCLLLDDFIICLIPSNLLIIQQFCLNRARDKRLKFYQII